jgi:hypothetical protein
MIEWKPVSTMKVNVEILIVEGSDSQRVGRVVVEDLG